jgi:hypothetical protein
LADKESAVLNIFDLMGAAQGGTGLDAMARQFGLTQDQAQRAFTALMPAFALGLQRNASTPDAFANLMGMAGFGQPTEPKAQEKAKEALGQLFGPPELTRQIAEQAAHWSGVSAQVLQQMMPIFAAALVASLSKFSEVMRAQAGSAPAASPSPAAAQPYAAWAEMMRALMGGGASPAPQPSPAASSDDPAAKAAAEPKTQPAAETAPPPPSAEDLQAIWSQAMASGQEAQAQYLATLQNIFDQFWGAGPGRR